MTKLRVILGDQLSASISSLEDIEKNDSILICEVMEEATYVQHHPKKIVFLFSAMRHFAEELKSKAHNVRHVKLTDKENTGTIMSGLKCQTRWAWRSLAMAA